MKLPPVLENAIYGFMASQCVFSAVELGIFDALLEGPSSAFQIAKRCNIPTESAERLLLGLVAMRVLERKNEVYSLPPGLSPYFDPASSEYCCAILGYFQRNSYRLFGHLADGVREARPQWHRLEGREISGRDVFESIYGDADRLEAFVDGMWALGSRDEAELVERINWFERRVLVDIGGCSGSFAIAALRQSQRLTAVVFDRAEVRPFCLARAAQFGLGQRLEFRSGDFFRDDLPVGDAYALGYIISDWGRQQATDLLTRVFKALPSGGILMILEKLFDDDKSGPLPTAMMNLCMLLEQEGQHYSGPEYLSWLREIGFSDIEIIRSSGEKHAIVARKA